MGGGCWVGGGCSVKRLCSWGVGFRPTSKISKPTSTFLPTLIWSISCGIVPVSDRTIGPIFSIIGGRCLVNRRGLLNGRGLLGGRGFCEKVLLGGGGGVRPT